MRRLAPIIFSIAAGFLLCGCAIQRAEVARNAQVQMIGLPKEKVLACMGVPANKMTVGTTEVWQYQSGNGQREGAVTLSGDGNFASGVAISTERFCNINIVMANGTVSQVNYSGPTGGLLSAGEQCAYAVQNCAHQ